MGNNNSKSIQYIPGKKANNNYINFDEEEKKEVIKKDDFIKLNDDDNKYISIKPIKNTHFNL